MEKKELTQKEFAALGGKASALSRFEGFTEQEVSDIMKKIRAGYTPEYIKWGNELAEAFVKNLNRNVAKDK